MNTRDSGSPITLPDSARSDVAFRSNIYLRAACELHEDRQFIARVRGHGALNVLLSKLSPLSPPNDTARHYLTNRQLAEWLWSGRCDMCGCVPEGPVIRGGKEEIEFRCPRGTCHASQRVSRMVLLDSRLVGRACEELEQFQEEVIRLALSRGRSAVIRPPDLSRQPRRFTVRLTRWQAYMLEDMDIENALWTLIEERQDARSQRV